jgi:hypothetical protein
LLPDTIKDDLNEGLLEVVTESLGRQLRGQNLVPDFNLGGHGSLESWNDQDLTEADFSNINSYRLANQ